jgi:Na+/glutamate symporter
VRKILRSNEPIHGGPISIMLVRIILVGELIIFSRLKHLLLELQMPQFILQLWGRIIVQWGLKLIKKEKLKIKNGGFFI